MNILKVKKLTAVALCKQGKNPVADVVLYKSNSSKEVKRMSLEALLATLPEEQQKVIKEALDAANVKANELTETLKSKTNEIEQLTAKIGELEKALDELKKAPKNADEHKSTDCMDDEEILKSVDPRIAEMIKKAKSEAETAKAILKAIEEEKIAKSFIEKAATYNSLPISPEVLGPALRQLSEKCDAAVVETFNNLLELVNKVMAESVLFTEAGKNANSSEATVEKSAWAKIEAKAIEMAKSLNITKEQAISRVIIDNPALYKAYIDETKEVN